MNFQESLDYIKSLTPTLERPTLVRLSSYFEEAGEPQNKLASFHVGGTNGKGSVSSLIASMLEALGYKTGKFTGPHLMSFRERFAISGRSISEADFADCASRIHAQSAAFAQRHPDLGKLTWFEFLTAMAVDYFVAGEVDRSVFEVGLGGRFDATNVLGNVLVSTICNVEMDHMHLLGDSREKIAFEKAGIIKKGVPVVTACDGAALEIVISRAKLQKSPVVALGFSLDGDPYRDFGATIFGADAEFSRKMEACIKWVKRDFLGSMKAEERDVMCGMAGAYQKGNVLLALISVLIGGGYLEFLGEPQPDLSEILLKGLKEAYWPGRYQILENEKIILDGAHNPHGAKALRTSLQRQFGGPFVFIFSCFENKNARDILQNLIGKGDIVVAFSSPSERAMHSPEKIVEIAASLGATACAAADFGEALDKAASARSTRSASKYAPYIVATGSFATVREAWRHFHLADI